MLLCNFLVRTLQYFLKSWKKRPQKLLRHTNFCSPWSAKTANQKNTQCSKMCHIDQGLYRPTVYKTGPQVLVQCHHFPLGNFFCKKTHQCKNGHFRKDCRMGLLYVRKERIMLIHWFFFCPFDPRFFVIEIARCFKDRFDELIVGSEIHREMVEYVAKFRK